MHFCKQCSNMLYPMVIDKKLYGYCRSCGYKEENTDYEIYSKSYTSNIFKDESVQKYLGYDMTLPRTANYKCPNEECNTHKDESKKEAVYFNEHGSLKLIHICTECNTEWGY